MSPAHSRMCAADRLQIDDAGLVDDQMIEHAPANDRRQLSLLVPFNRDFALTGEFDVERGEGPTYGQGCCLNREKLTGEHGQFPGCDRFFTLILRGASSEVVGVDYLDIHATAQEQGVDQ